MTITILDAARARGVQEIDGSINASEFDRVGLPFFAGCQCCEASLGPYNAYPSRTGFIRCSDCIDDTYGFATVEDFDAFDEENPPVDLDNDEGWW